MNLNEFNRESSFIVITLCHGLLTNTFFNRKIPKVATYFLDFLNFAPRSGLWGLELHILHRPHMDSIDLDPPPILGMGSDIY